MLLKVTQEHIDKGVKANCSKCPIALAMLEQIPEQLGVASVSEPSAQRWGLAFNVDKQRVYTNSAPVEVGNFMGRLDVGASVEPFEFETGPFVLSTWHGEGDKWGWLEYVS